MPDRVGTAAWAAVLLPVALTSWLGGYGPGRIELNLGPGDSPYIEGFVPSYEVEGRRRTHWTTYDAAIELPVELRGGPVKVSYRYARDFPETAEVEVLLSGRPIDYFSFRGSTFQERSVGLAGVDAAPVRVSFLSDSHERRNMGLKLDWLRVDYGSEATVRLHGRAAWRPLLLVVLCLAGFRLLGWSAVASALLCAGPVVVLSVGLWRDPWLTHRFLTGVPPAVFGYFAVALTVGWVLVRWRGVFPKSRRHVTTLAFGAFLLRALLVSHPDFYYPDQGTHATLVRVLQGSGLDFFRHPASYIYAHGVWVTGAYGRTYAFPYSPAFHLPFALFPIPYDSVITWMKLVAAAWSTLPLVLVWALARRFGVPVWGSLLMLFIPTYTSRLSFAFLPSLFGHAFDLALIYWLAGHVDKLDTRRVCIAGAVFVAACQLAYVSGVLNISILVVLVAALELVRRGDGAARRAAAVAGMLAVGSMLSFALFYRDFLPMVTDVVTRVARGAPGAESRYPIRGFFDVAYSRTRDFFGALYPPLVLWGVSRLRGVGARAGVLWAWGFAYLVLLAGRAKMPDIFLHGHETLFITPLVCLLSGTVIGPLWSAGGGRRAAAAVVLGALAAQGFYLQWQAVAVQLFP